MVQRLDPVRVVSSADAFNNLKTNLFGSWPRSGDPDDRFAALADPACRPRFTLQAGQRIFTIGSCFARNVEEALARRGFDIPTRQFLTEAAEGDTGSILNNYVPSSIAPQIRWAFDLEPFDVERHCAEVRRGGFLDLHLVSSMRPMSLPAVLERRRRIGVLYRKLSSSHVVLITLGLAEAWFDRLSSSYLNMAPPKGLAQANPARFELHILEYNQIVRDLHDLIQLLKQVCPADHHVIFTVSPVPLTATFTEADVSVANMYSKSVLRAAVGVIVESYGHTEYFPSFESVMLTDRSIAFGEDQVHVTPPIVRSNVDRMIGAYVAEDAAEPVSVTIQRALGERRAGNLGTAMRILRSARAAHPDDAKLLVALADIYLRSGNPAPAEEMLRQHLRLADDPAAHLLLARHCLDSGRYEAAAYHAEHVAHSGTSKLPAAMVRVEAYYNLGRYDDALAVLAKLRAVHERAPLVMFWQAKLHEKLDDPSRAEDLYLQCNRSTEKAEFMVGFANFLAGSGRTKEAADWCDKALRLDATNVAALKLRTKLAVATLTSKALARRTDHPLLTFWRRAIPGLRRAKWEN